MKDNKDRFEDSIWMDQWHERDKTQVIIDKLNKIRDDIELERKLMGHKAWMEKMRDKYGSKIDSDE
jgi:hypothetical protein